MKEINLNKNSNLTLVKWDEVTGATTPGMLPKAKINIKNREYYLKLGSYSSAFGFYGREPIFELLNSRVGELLGVPVLSYSLINADILLHGQLYNTLISISENYRRIDEKRYSIERFYLNNRLQGESPLDTLKRFNLEKIIYQIFVYDFIICNMDRHNHNIEILENTTNNSLRVAPFFDNSLCFVSNRNETDYKVYKYYNDKNPVNNYVGSMNLMDNLYLIDKPIVVRKLRPEDRKKLFQGLGKCTTKEFRDYYWWFINRRVEDVQNCKISFIKFK